MSEKSAIEVAVSGSCVVCGCTEESPCFDDGERCAWTDESRTMCDFCAEAAYDASRQDAEEAALIGCPWGMEEDELEPDEFDESSEDDEDDDEWEA